MGDQKRKEEREKKDEKNQQCNVCAIIFTTKDETFNYSYSESVKVNALIQSKVDMKSLRLGHAKCFKMHVGKS